MKKIIIKIVIALFAIIVIMLVGVLFYTKFIMFVPDKNVMINKTNNENEKEVKFKNITEKQWAEMIAKYQMCDVKMVKCYYENGKFIGVVNNEKGETIAHYEFESETGYALELFTGHKVDLVNRKVIERNLAVKTQIEFEKNQILAIGYAPDIKLNDFIKKNFVNKESFEKLIIRDYRKEESRINSDVNRLVIFPKTSDVEVEIYDCYITENKEAKIIDQLGETLNEGFILLQQYMAESTIPELCIIVKYHGIEDIIPIAFNAKDGKLDLTDHERLVKDISFY